MTNFKQALFMNNNRKTHVYMNKFAKATINTYTKKNSILSSKRT